MSSCNPTLASSRGAATCHGPSASRRSNGVRARGLVLLLAACTTSPPPPARAIAAIMFLPEIAAEGAAAARILYQDGALPTPVPGGTLWTFGDTFLGTRHADGSPAYAGDRSNTMAWLPAGERGLPPKLRYLVDASGAALPPLALLADEDAKTRRLWPLAGVQLGARSYLFYGRIDVTGVGPWGFRPVGTGLAVSDTPFAPYRRLAEPNASGWPIDPTSIVRHDGWLWLYAPRRFHGEHDLRSGLLIARVRPADIERPERYEFFAGNNSDAVVWTPRLDDAVAAADDVWGQAGVAWHDEIEAFVLATSSNFFRHDGIRLRRSETPFGPWTPLGPDDGWITVPERPGETTQLIYCTMLHPELDAPDARTTTLTFCRMLKRDWAFTNPEVVRIEWAAPSGR